ncbi:tRNA (Cytosine-5-)-methyltransferase [Elysia marginata]|uniref:tRNA (cytosine(38)-C(5))-methyltransferase n=1 Tax=Elysia marginata TaxID=1093978 RepID=A0AAV4F7P1_9GAST|nr:tRNA (Cytosine-5-)-methyltransferase [Elysia marginata]
MPNKVLTHINRIFFRFIWKKKYCNKRAFEKVRRKTVCNETKNGGLKMFNIINIQSAAYKHWAEALLTEEEEWKKWARQALKPLGAGAAFLCTNEKATREASKFKSLAVELQNSREWQEKELSLLRRLRLRYFTPREVANLLCFPSSFTFPEDVTKIQKYRVLGNSLNVHVVSELIKLMVT